MKIDGGGLDFNAMRSQMQAIRENGGVSREQLGDLQAKAKEFGGPAAQHLEKLSNSFDSVDTDSDGLISRTEMRAFAESQGMKPPFASGPPVSLGGDENDLLDQLLSGESNSSSEDDDEEEEENTRTRLEQALRSYSSNFSSDDGTSSLLEIL